MRSLPAEVPHGFVCQAACYQLLHARLGYKLAFEDIRPLLKQLPKGLPGRFKDDVIGSGALASQFGGIRNYHGQVNVVHIPLLLRLPVQLQKASVYQLHIVLCICVAYVV